VSIQSDNSRSGQSGSETSLMAGDRRERRVNSKDADREDSDPKTTIADAEVFVQVGFQMDHGVFQRSHLNCLYVKSAHKKIHQNPWPEALLLERYGYFYVAPRYRSIDCGQNIFSNELHHRPL
jgi:hypothetical protein